MQLASICERYVKLRNAQQTSNASFTLCRDQILRLQIIPTVLSYCLLGACLPNALIEI